MGHARSLISLENAEIQNALFLKTISEEWSVRKLEDAVRQSSHIEVNPEDRSDIKVDQLRTWQANLSSIFKLPVSLKMNDNGKGELKVSFKSKEELEKLIIFVQK
jgi:ParB family chromosome partitioning protein